MVQTNMKQAFLFYTTTKKWTLECVFGYNLVSPNSFCYKLVAFLNEHVYAFILNTG